jgi:hypothetical protein
MMREPLPAPSSSGARVAGDRFQWLVAWQACIMAIREAATNSSNPIVRVGIEVDDVGNVDDVVLWRKRSPHTFCQVKYAVDDRALVNGEYLTTPGANGGPSLLAKLVNAWRHLASDSGEVELSLVTNRAPDPKDPLVSGRDARTRLLVPRATRGGPGSAAGQARSAWGTAVGLSEPELLTFLSVLDFDLARDVMHLEQHVGNVMLLSGLRGDERAINAGIDWVARMVVAGHRHLDLEDIQNAIDDLCLRSDVARTLVSIATLLPDRMSEQAGYAIDWVDRFDGEDAYTKRKPKNPWTWAQLQADLESIPAHLGGARHVGVTGSMRLATSFTVGATLRMVTGADVSIIQRGELWSSESEYALPTEPEVDEIQLGRGPDLAVAVEVAAPIGADVESFLRQADITADRLVVIRPPGGPKDTAICSAQDASALAVGIRNQVRVHVRGHPRVHLFLAVPVGLALLLGHRWNRVAPTLVYEDLASLGYEAAFFVSA